MLVDGITVLVSNVFLAESGLANANPFDAKVEEAADVEIAQLLRIIPEIDVGFLLISNEVEKGLVPPYALGRAYRDLLGRVNQVVSETFFLVAGILMRVK